MSILYYQGQLDILYNLYDEHIKNNNIKLALKDCYNALDCLSKIKDILIECNTFPIEIMDDNHKLYKIDDVVEGFDYFSSDENNVKKILKILFLKCNFCIIFFINKKILIKKYKIYVNNIQFLDYHIYKYLFFYIKMYIIMII